MIRTEAECKRLLAAARLLVEEYENRAHPLPKGNPARMLRYLLKEKESQ